MEDVAIVKNGGLTSSQTFNWTQNQVQNTNNRYSYCKNNRWDIKSFNRAHTQDQI